ncbi:hypothetical protein [Ferruginibacter albus]|uniref:hypothetical protein n=1 Tax=Ferruginibacter albus TaxID=2875540 RepID=UPI001CC42A91|nr:hypothetical protein [Ferruginibacter albus]UAY53119.1 hypothetical protein K9M53_05445 [Ferruginibacter albus]
MKIVYTVCTLNRLGQIAVLGKSLLQHNPDYHFIIGLADEVDNRINIEDYKPFEFISLSQLNSPDQKQLTEQYDVFELSCALKAYYGDYIFKTYKPDIVFYFDTDIKIYDSLKVLEDKLNNHSILLTPHILSPLPADNKYIMERDFLNSGIYNAGFIGLKNDINTMAFLKWWKERLFDQGFNNVCIGLMVDQLWLNHVPIFFRNVLLIDHPGCNFAYWNMHERTLEKKDNSYFVNNVPLIFFHFSGYRIDQPEKISIHQNRFSFSDNKYLKDFFEDYRQSLIQNNFEKFLSIKALYGKSVSYKKKSFIKDKAIKALRLVLNRLEK